MTTRKKMQKMQKQRRKAALEKAAFDRGGRRPDESLAAYMKRKQANDEAIRALRGYQLYTRKIKPTFEEWAKKLRAEFGSEANDDHLQKLWTEITEKRKQRREDVFRRLAESRGQKYEPPPTPGRSEVPATPVTPEPVTPIPKQPPWERGPLPAWARPLAPQPARPSGAVSTGRGQIAARVIFALARLTTAAMLLWALARHPIGYYTVLRLVTAGVCLYAAYLAVQDKQPGWVFIFGGMVLLFQPLIPLRMTRQTWNNIDVAAALFLVASIGLFKRPTFSEP